MKQSDLDQLTERASRETVNMEPMQRALWVMKMLREVDPKTEWVLQCVANGMTFDWKAAVKDKGKR